MRCVLGCVLLAFAAFANADDFQSISAQAAAARDANNAPEAIRLYRQALSLNPQWQEGWWFLGTLLYDGDQYAPGREAFQHFVDLNPQAAPGWAFLGLCEFETKDYAKALSDIEHGLSLGADRESQLGPVLLYHEALLLTEQGQFDAALQKYNALLHGMQGRTLNEPMVIAIGLAALRTPLLPDDLARDKNGLFLAGGKAGSFLLMGDYAQAESAMNELLAKYPQTPNVHYLRGLYFLARDPDAAFDEFQRELEISPSNTQADTMLAWGLLTRGDPELALPHARNAAQAAHPSAFANIYMDAH